VSITSSIRCTAFCGTRRIASGVLHHVALVAQREYRAHADMVRIFDDRSSHQIKIDLRGDSADLLKRLSQGAIAIGKECDAAPLAHSGPGRPKLGVVAREVTLLPRHWRWLAAQPGGASVALRRLVDNARRCDAGTDRKRAAQEATYRFMLTMADGTQGIEPASRALFAGDAAGFEEHTAAWPEDVRDHAALLAAEALRD